MSLKLSNLDLRALLGSNGRLTLGAVLESSDGKIARSIAQRGSTVGIHEPRQIDVDRFMLESLGRHLDDVRAKILPRLVGAHADQQEFDTRLDDLYDGGAITGDIAIALSSAFFKLAEPVREEATGTGSKPNPIVNVFDGRVNASSHDKGVEYLAFFDGGGDTPYEKKVSLLQQVSASIGDELARADRHHGYSHQGALYAPFSFVEENVAFLRRALARFDVPISIGLDMSASDRFDATTGAYKLRLSSDDAQTQGADELARRYAQLVEYGIGYIEDPFSELDLSAWADLRHKRAFELLVGDDLFASQARLIDSRSDVVTGVVLKPNQARTISAFFDAVKGSKRAGLKTIVSQRTSETDDALIAELAALVDIQYSKFGGLARQDRLLKYNHFLWSRSE